MIVTIDRHDAAERQYSILDEAIIDLQHCIEALRQEPIFSDYASTMTEIRHELGSKQSECETILEEWDREQELLDRIAYERSVL